MVEKQQSFAAAIKAWRAVLGVSQAGAARLLACSKRTLQNWEIARNEPSPMLERLLRARFAEDMRQLPKAASRPRTPPTPRAPARRPSRAS